MNCHGDILEAPNVLPATSSAFTSDGFGRGSDSSKFSEEVLRMWFFVALAQHMPQGSPPCP
jgi:hypothetical protein